MTNIDNRTPINENNNDDINLSIEAEDVQNYAAGSYFNRQINRCILFNDNHQPVRFGQARPLPPDHWIIIITTGYFKKIIKCLGIMILLLLIFFGGIRLLPNILPSKLETISDNNHAGLIIKEEIVSDCSNQILEDKLSINIDNKIIDMMMYNEPNVQDMFKETHNIDDSTCALCDMVSYIFNKLCSLKDNIIGFIPIEPHTDKQSMNDDNEKSGQPSSIADNSFASKIEQNGAHRVDQNSEKETSSLNSADEDFQK